MASSEVSERTDHSPADGSDIIRDVIFENTTIGFMESARIAELIRERIDYETGVLQGSIVLKCKQFREGE